MAYLPVETRNAPISRARLKRLVSAGNRLTLVIAMWALLWPRPYVLLMVLCLLLPAVALGMEFRFRGRVDWEERRRKTSPFSVATIATMPALALFVRTLTDLNILDWRLMIAWWAFGAICIAGGICTLDPRVRESLNQLAQIVLFAIAYSCGTLGIFNVVLDPHESSETRTQIMHMRVRVSGGTKASTIWHEVKVESFVSPAGAAWVHVRPDVYGELQIGETVCVHSGRGLLAVRWFDVRFCSAG